MSGSLGQFRALTQALVQQAIGIVGDLTESVVYVSNPTTAYDATTGETTVTGTTYTFRAVVTRFDLKEADAQVVVEKDAKLLVAFLDLPAEPDEADTVAVTFASTGETKNYHVIRSIGTPGQSLWTIHIREK